MERSELQEEIEKHAYVMLYAKKDRMFEELVAYTDDECCCIDLSSDDYLHREIMETYKISELPVLLYRGHPVYANGAISDELDHIDTENIKKTENFLKEFIQPIGLTVFVKGTIEKPYCKFTKQLISIFKEQGLENVKDFNIFTDNNLRYYMKTINKWPTFPMIYLNGQFIGGLDSFKGLVEAKSPLLFGEHGSTDRNTC